MVELIFIIVLFLSLTGMAVILWRKIPVLCELRERDLDFYNSFVDGVRGGMERIPGIKSFSYELYLQKLLSKIRVLTMKTENKTGSWLEKLRQRSCRKNRTSNDDYWDTLKKAKNGR
ncbi:MAG: hypothetical protein ABIB55_00065 [Candidatus Nealsonbacteria bacterium]